LKRGYVRSAPRGGIWRSEPDADFFAVVLFWLRRDRLAPACKAKGGRQALAEQAVAQGRL